MTAKSSEYVTLEAIDDVVVNANLYTEDSRLERVIGLGDPEANVMTMVYHDLHWVKWTNLLTPEQARTHLVLFDPTNQDRRFYIDRDPKELSSLDVTRDEFKALPVDDAVELHSQGGDNDPIVVWRKPLPDEVPYSRIIAYLHNDGTPLSPGLRALVESTIAPETKPVDLDRTLRVFHEIYMKYADLIRK